MIPGKTARPPRDRLRCCGPRSEPRDQAPERRISRDPTNRHRRFAQQHGCPSGRVSFVRVGQLCTGGAALVPRNGHYRRAGGRDQPRLEGVGLWVAPEAPWDPRRQAAAGSRRPRIGGNAFVLVRPTRQRPVAGNPTPRRAVYAPPTSPSARATSTAPPPQRKPRAAPQRKPRTDPRRPSTKTPRTAALRPQGEKRLGPAPRYPDPRRGTPRTGDKRPAGRGSLTPTGT